jgi:F0F1-type ATP synthase epsilon subunit
MAISSDVAPSSDAARPIGRPPAAREGSAVPIATANLVVIVVPEPVTASALHAEFANRFSVEVIDRTLDVARHVLERSHSSTTSAAVEALARESLNNRPSGRR